MKFLVGLGNPGDEYDDTRHNVGFRVIDEVRRRHGNPPERRRRRCAVARFDAPNGEIVLARPLTYMNRSGGAVRALLDETGLTGEDLLVVCDDLNLDFGRLRIRPRGSHGGQNGLRSIIEALGTTEFPRLRVGIGPAAAGMDQADFVLQRFPTADRLQLPEIIQRAADCIEMLVESGLERAMNRYNGHPDGDHNEEP